MESFEYTEILASDKADDDEYRVKVFMLNPSSMEFFDTCNMLVLWLERKVMGWLREEPVFVPASAFSWELSRNDDSLLSYLENEMTNPDQLTIKTHHKKKGNFFVIPL